MASCAVQCSCSAVQCSAVQCRGAVLFSAVQFYFSSTLLSTGGHQLPVEENECDLTGKYAQLGTGLCTVEYFLCEEDNKQTITNKHLKINFFLYSLFVDIFYVI